MPVPIRDLDVLLRSLQPSLNAGTYAWCTLSETADWAMLDPVAMVREPEGRSLVLEETAALAAGLAIAFRAAWITLDVPSDLAAVGLTAAVADALTAAGISCNVVAGVHHDHLFVPVARANDAMAVLEHLQRSHV